GDFLPGFSVPQAAEFERWVEATRDRLRFAAADAAATLCATARAAGRVSEAIGWARKRLDVMPIDELALRDLLPVLAEAGDRGQDAETYRAFARELASCLDTAPSRETQDLLRAILQDVDASSARVVRLRSRV